MFAFVPLLALLAASSVDATASSCSAGSFHLDDDLYVSRVQEFGSVNLTSVVPCLPPSYYPPIPLGIDFDFDPYCGGPIQSIDGYCNNIYDPTAGQVGKHVKRLTNADFDDGELTERIDGLPEARFLSNHLFAQNYFDDSSLNGNCLNDLHTHFGQFFNHDKHTSGAGAPSPKPIPDNDQWLDPASEIAFRRSLFEDVPLKGNIPINPAATGHLDLSVVYGTSAAILSPLLDFTTGKFLVEEKVGGEFPPEFNHPFFGPLLQLGDGVRGNTHPALMSLQVLFLREHNYWIERLGSMCISCEVEHSAKFNTLGYYYGHSNKRNGKHCVYVPFAKRWNVARRITISMIQRMVVFEWFPALLGEKTIPYYGYQSTCNARPTVEAMAAALRFGHSSLRDFVQRRNYKDELVNDSIGGFNRLEDVLFDPTFLTAEPEGLDHVFRGSLHVQQSRTSLDIPNVLRSIQIGATDIARGRDMGIPGYFQVKRELGLHGPGAGLISEVNEDFPEARWKLAEFYNSEPEKIDLFAGMLSEDLPVGSTVGETCAYILKDMLDTIRHCDRFYFENPGVFSKVLFDGEVDAATDDFFLNLVHDSPMSEILMRNTDISRYQIEGYVATVENIFIMKKDRCQGDGGEEPFDLPAWLGLDMGLNYKGGKHAFPPSPYPSPTPYP